MKQVCNLLLIEDNQIHAKLIQSFLGEEEQGCLSENFVFKVTWVQTLGEGLEELTKHSFNVILLDLMLPDSRGLETLETTLKHCPNTPVVVQTGTEDTTIVVKSLQLGAYGFLPKQNLDSNLLVYGIRLAIEQHLQGMKIEEAAKKEQQQMELEWLNQFVATGTTNITARLYGTSSLRETFPEIFQDQVEIYGSLLDLALEQQAYKIDYNISEKLRNQAEKLGILKAGPRDVVEIHTTALKAKTQSVNVAKAQAYVIEGRLMVLEMMGYLTSYYRKFYLGLNNMTIYKNSN
jgi:DNA-binding NarL/FixJ family response regulator